MLGMLAGYHVYPHLVTDDELRVRSGVYHDIHVPRASIARAAVHERDLPSSVWLLQVEAGDDGPDGDVGDDVAVGISGRTNVTLTFDRPTVLATAKGDLHAATLSFWADEPRTVAGMLDPDRRTSASKRARR